MQIGGDIGARRIIQSNPEQVQEVQLQNPHIFWDVDTPEDLLKIKKLF
jgi:CTP:molybdopterin cytidylyltransferase MocA